MTKQDYFIAAASMLALYKADAPIRAAMRADAALHEGNTERFHFWQNVEAVLMPRELECRN